MALDIAMGGSTNTSAHPGRRPEGEVDFDLADIDAVRRRVPCLCKVSPNSDYHMEDVHRAGGIPAILGELCAGGLLNEGVRTRARPLARGVAVDVGRAGRGAVGDGCRAVPRRTGGVRTTKAFSTENRWSSLDTDAADGCIRDVAHAYTADGGLACCAATSPRTVR